MLTASASGLYVFAAQCPTPPILYLRFAAYLAIGLAQDSRPSGSLLLPCKALSSSTFMPVYPGALISQYHSLRSTSEIAFSTLSVLFFPRPDLVFGFLPHVLRGWSREARRLKHSANSSVPRPNQSA